VTRSSLAHRALTEPQNARVPEPDDQIGLTVIDHAYWYSIPADRFLR